MNLIGKIVVHETLGIGVILAVDSNNARILAGGEMHTMPIDNAVSSGVLHFMDSKVQKYMVEKIAQEKNILLELTQQAG